MDKKEQRKVRKAVLETMTLQELGGTLPYEKGIVTGIKTDPQEPTLPSAAEMIETILDHEGLPKQ